MSDLNSKTKLEKNGFKILVIDDETDILSSISAFLEQTPFEAITTTSAEEAIKIVQTQESKIAMVLCDYRLPGLNGFEFRSSLLEKGIHIPFTIFSGYITREDALKGMELRVSSFLEKPFSFEALLSCIEKESKDRVQALKEEQELLTGFIEEAKGNLELLEPLVLELEAQPQDLEIVNRIFGLVHTLKGASGFFRPLTLHHFVHKFEDLLSRLKTGQQPINRDIINVILKALSHLNTLVEELRTGNHLHTDLEALLQDLIVTQASEEPEKTSAPGNSGPGKATKTSELDLKKDLRVPIELLDEFMQISGEMTVIRNMIAKVTSSIERLLPGNKEVALLNDLVEETHKINGNIQSKVIEIRKVPIKTIVRSFPRTVRELAHKLGKEVDFITVGEDLRVDTAIGDVLNNSLIHMIRNSVDHGIEKPEERTAAGKPSKGTIKIESRLKGDDIILDITDDGRGISPKNIRAKLLKNGMPREQIDRMTEQQILLQLFEPGFSTAEQVTEVSGRGVGMDMVKKAITSVKGEIQVNSTPGKGSHFQIKIPTPRSVNIISSLIVKVENQRFCIPRENIQRVMEIPPEEKSKLIVSLEGTRALHLFGELIPLVELSKTLKLSHSADTSENMKVIVLKSAEAQVLAITVDDILDFEDTVMKPLPPSLAQQKAFMGVTFMGDGHVGLILSSTGLGELFHVQPEHSRSRTSVESQAGATSSSDQIILFELEGASNIFGVPQSEVNRLEALSTSDFQKVGDQYIIPYRGKTLKIVDLAQKLSISKSSESANKQSVVALITNPGLNPMGFVVKSIYDIKECSGKIDDFIKDRPGIMGSVEVSGKTVTMVQLKDFAAGSDETAKSLLRFVS